MFWENIAMGAGLTLVAVLQMVVYLLGFERLHLHLRFRWQLVTAALLAGMTILLFGGSFHLVARFASGIEGVLLLITFIFFVSASVLAGILFLFRSQKKLKVTQEHLAIHAGVSGMIISGIVLLSLPVLLIFAFIPDQIRADLLTRRFHEEIKQVKGATMRQIYAWEGDGIAEINVTGKGIVSLDYGPGGVEGLRGMAGYPGSFTCYYLDEKGKRVEYAYDYLIGLGKDSEFRRWFPEVQSLQDVVNKYDELLAAYKKLPHNPEMEEFVDFHGKREVVKYPDDRFRLYKTEGNRRIACDVYTKE